MANKTARQKTFDANKAQFQSALSQMNTGLSAFQQNSAVIEGYLAEAKKIQDANAAAAAAGAANAAANKEQDRKQAKAYLESWLTTFFDPVRDKDTIKAMMGWVDGQILDDQPTEAIMLNIRQQPFYQQRFAGNEGLRKAGLAELTPEQYLQAEQSYSDLLHRANLGDLATRSNFASMIGGQVSATELSDRISNVYLRIKNADSALRDEMQRLGELGNLNASDFAAALLMGNEGAASLQRKIATAEVSTEFTSRGMQSALGASELANLGVTRDQARAGAEYVGKGTQRLSQLTDVYGGSTAGLQSELEKEAFKGMESQRRKKLTEQEQAAFAGSSGSFGGSLGSQTLGNF